MLMFDSLNRHMLPPYHPETWVHAPNFQRLARRAVTFDSSYVGSMPCMPARRDFQTGRPNFLHTAWGPLEPYDDSVPQMLSEAGVYTSLISDHYHYWEDGGSTYHGRYDSWQFYRGQEGDPWYGQVAAPEIPENINGKGKQSDWINRPLQRDEDGLSQTQTVRAGIEFIERNASEDNWFLQIECFDPHEPFVSNRKYQDLYPSDYDGPLLDWPGYREVSESPEQVEHARRNYAALMSKCDASLGDVLDALDRNGLWEETMLVVWTDHGYLLGEHSCWAKNWMPLFEQVSHTPFFVWDPRIPRTAGERRGSLVQPSLDLGPTLLSFFGLEPTPRMLGHDLAGVIDGDTPVRDAALFGYFGQAVNITDGRYVYMRQPVMEGGGPSNFYSLMPVKMRGFREPAKDLSLTGPFSFTRGMRVMCWPHATGGERLSDPGHLLFDLQRDPEQTTSYAGLPEGAADASPVPGAQSVRRASVEARAGYAEIEERLKRRMVELMADCEAPAEQYERTGLDPTTVTTR